MPRRDTRLLEELPKTYEAQDLHYSRYRIEGIKQDHHDEVGHEHERRSFLLIVLERMGTHALVYLF